MHPIGPTSGKLGRRVPWFSTVPQLLWNANSIFSSAGLKILTYKSSPSEYYQNFLIMQTPTFKSKTQNSKIRSTRPTSFLCHTSKTVHFSPRYFFSVPLCIQPTFTRRTSRYRLRNFRAAVFLPLSRNGFCVSYNIFSDFNVLSRAGPSCILSK